MTASYPGAATRRLARLCCWWTSEPILHGRGFIATTGRLQRGNRKARPRTRSSANEGNAPNNRRRKSYSALYTYQEFLDYQLATREAILDAIDESVAFQTSNTGPIVFRGSRPIPAHPAPHPGEAPPPEEPSEGVLDPPPCGYVLSEQQFSAPQPDGPTAGDRLTAHGIKFAHRRGRRDYWVPMDQAQRGLIPLLLDGEAAEPILAARRVAC
jgi:hypothetical protein